MGVYVALGVGSGSTYRGRIVDVGDDGIIFQPADSLEHTSDLPPRRFYAWGFIRDAQPLEEVPNVSSGMAMVGDDE